MALYTSVSRPYDQGYLYDRSLTALEILADRRLHLELPGIVPHLGEMSLLLLCAPVSRHKLPLAFHNDSEMTVEFTGMSVKRIV